MRTAPFDRARGAISLPGGISVTGSGKVQNWLIMISRPRARLGWPAGPATLAAFPPCQRQVDRDRKSAAWGVRQRRRAAARQREPVDYGESEAGTAAIAGGEPPECHLLLQLAHARTIVSHLDPSPVADCPGGDPDRAAARQDIQGIGDQVVQDLLQVPVSYPGGHSLDIGLQPHVPLLS